MIEFAKILMSSPTNQEVQEIEKSHEVMSHKHKAREKI